MIRPNWLQHRLKYLIWHVQAVSMFDINIEGSLDISANDMTTNGIYLTIADDKITGKILLFALQFM